jgi:hypothetical protein
MRGKRIEIKGINRSITPAENDVGYCSELINLKPQNGIKVVGKKEVMSANIPYEKVIRHRINNIYNHIGIQNDATGVKIVHFEPSSGAVIKTIATFPAGHEVYFTTLTNQLVISDKTDIKEYVYSFENEYKLLYSGVNFDFHFNMLTVGVSLNGTYEKKIYAKSKDEYIAGCRAYLNEFEKENKNACEGRYLYAFTITYYDGTEANMYGLSSVGGNFDGTLSDRNFLSAVGSQANGDSPYLTTKFNVKGYYYKSTLIISENKEFYEKYKDLIKSVNLYASMPATMFPLSVDNVSVSGMGWEEEEITNVPSVYIHKQDVKDAGLEKQLLYKQKSWSLEQFCNGTSYALEFSGDEQTTGATMEVYGSNIDRAGMMYTYNKRVHFYNSAVRLNTYLPSAEYKPLYYDELTESTLGKANILIYLKESGKNLVLRYDNQNVLLAKNPINGEMGYIPTEFFMFPDSRAYRMEVIVTSAQTSSLSSAVVGKKYTVTLSPSPSYNYAYAFGGLAQIADNGIVFDGIYPQQVNTYIETDVVNVTSAGLPFNFPVNLSYRFDGNITALGVAIEDISTAQVGQYPLNVFTDNGVFALQQGSGQVLYSSIVPISNDVCLNKSIISTKQGLVYIAHDSIFLLQGKSSTKLSLFLEGEIDTYIQNNPSFLKCCGGQMYDITDLLSVVPIREYLDGATLSYSPTTNELIVSNAEYNYSYVLCFTYNVWYKVTGTFTGVEDALMLTPVGVNEKGATSATGTITLSAIHSEVNKSFSSVCNAPYNTTYSCGAGNTIALIINDTQVASATFGQVTYMPMIVATLCDKISYLEDKVGTIYSKTDLSNQIVKVYNVTTAETLSSTTFVAQSEAVSIPNKAIGATITVTIAGLSFSYSYTASSSAVTMLNDITSQINKSSSCPVSAQIVRNTILLTAKNTGLATNNIKYSVTTTDANYIYISTQGATLTGGQDISLEPSSYKEIVDWTVDNPNGQTTVHLHTRPMCLDNPNGYKTLKRTVLNCLANLTGNQNLSMYIYASDNLIDYKCICAAQRQNVSVSQIIADRSAKAYKYFVVMIGGTVPNTTHLANIITTIEDVAEKKLR